MKIATLTSDVKPGTALRQVAEEYALHVCFKNIMCLFVIKIRFIEAASFVYQSTLEVPFTILVKKNHFIYNNYCYEHLLLINLSYYNIPQKFLRFLILLQLKVIGFLIMNLKF